MAATIRFRGVCLVHRDSDELLHVFFPKTVTTGDKKAKHFPRLTIYRSDGRRDGPFELVGDVGVETAAKLQAFNLDGVIRLSDAATTSQLLPVARMPLAAHVVLGSGTVTAETMSADLNSGAAHTAKWVGTEESRALEAQWASNDPSGTATIDVGGIRISLGTNDLAVFGHYDDPGDGDKNEIGTRPPPSDGDWRDHDFGWLYTLLANPPSERPVPLVIPTASGTGGRPGTSVLTSTCFLGSWP